MATCQLQDLDDEEFIRLTQSQSDETSVKRVNNGPPLPEGMRYHLFISHSNDTEDEVNWAKDVVRTLEKDFGFNCLLPSRDFVPGHEVLPQITDGIVKSAKIVCVFTPESLDSNWCEYERNLALDLSFNTGKGKIIPVLLKECEIPVMFRYINYIDVLKGENYIQRILGSFNDYDVPNMARVVQEMVETSRRRFEEENIDRLSGIQCRIFGHKTRFRGAAWSFKAVHVYERQLLGKLNNRFSEKLYNKARDIANRSLHLRYYSLTSDIRRTPFIFILLILAIALPVILGILVVEKTEQVFVISNNFDQDQFMALVYLICVCGLLVLVLMYCFHQKSLQGLKKDIQSLCIQQVMETDLLIKYGNLKGKYNVFGQPSIELMKYDIQPCLIFMTDFYVFHAKEEATEDLKIRSRKDAEMQILTYLNQNIDIMFAMLVPTSRVNRHPMCQKKACLCEILLANYDT